MSDDKIQFALDRLDHLESDVIQMKEAAAPVPDEPPIFLYDQTEEISDLVAALSKAQGEMTNPKFDKQNLAYKQADGSGAPYSSLGAVMNAVRGPLSKHGIAMWCAPAQFQDHTVVMITLAKGNQWIRCGMKLNPARRDHHGVAGATTYVKRLLVQAMTGVVGDDDDDGNAASGKEEAAGKSSSRSTPRRKTKTKKKVEVKPAEESQAVAIGEEQAAAFDPEVAKRTAYDLTIAWAEESGMISNEEDKAEAILSIIPLAGVDLEANGKLTAASMLKIGEWVEGQKAAGKSYREAVEGEVAQ